MKKPADVTPCTRVWIGDKTIAASTTLGMIGAMQKRFKNRLSIRPTKQGGIMVFPDQPGDQTSLDAFMATNTFLTPQMMRADRL